MQPSMREDAAHVMNGDGEFSTATCCADNGYFTFARMIKGPNAA